MVNNFSDKANFIWSVADLIRDTFKRGRYQDVILPCTVLRRIDSVLEPTKDTVLEQYIRYKDRLDNLDPMLRRASGFAFYNTSPYTFERLLADPGNLADNLRAYIAGFSQNMREVIDKFDFDNTISRLDEAGLLYLVLERFKGIDLHPDQVPNEEMGYIFEELIRRFNEALNENPGEHFTPREVIRLMVNLLVSPDRERLSQPHLVVTVSDACCGTGGMVILTKERIHEINPLVEVHLYGQEVNPETFAVCKSDLFITSADGRDAENIKFGSTLSDDQHAGRRFDYQLENPPYGKDWKMDREAVESEAERPGGRVAIVMNGSPLFTGDAGSGESQIRRWILEEDWLEAIVALPEQLFYNTGIATYVWILSNRKEARREDVVQLIEQITAIYEEFEESDRSKRFQTTDFGFRKVRVEHPLRLNFQAGEARIARLREEPAFLNLARSRKRSKQARATEEAMGRAHQAES